jgi:putative glutamine amidotransferase
LENLVQNIFTKEGIHVQPIIGIIGNFNGALIPEHANLPISYIGQGYLDAVKKAEAVT